LLSAKVERPGAAVIVTFDRDISHCAVSPAATDFGALQNEFAALSSQVESASGASVAIESNGISQEIDVVITCAS
jgi:hypothetical protein